MHEYSITEILLGSLFLFICKQDSRNAMNLDRRDPNFSENYFTLFGKRLPHGDTIDAVLRQISPDELERLKASLISSLTRKKGVQGDEAPRQILSCSRRRNRRYGRQSWALCALFT
jgi:hypothetical protein